MNCRLQTFNKVPGDKIGEYVLDANDSFIIAAEFDNGAIGVDPFVALGHAATSTTSACASTARRAGSSCSHGHWGSLLRICVGDDTATGTWQEVKAEPVQTNYQRFAEAVRTGVQTEPSFRHAAKLQQVLDLALVADLDRKEHKVTA